jgi:6-pyruvoyltetrahydropterin 2'-reductase
MHLVESFYSIQGEGRNAGFPSIFIRLGGCNLTCKGFGCETVSPLDNSVLIGCDSIRAVNAKHFKATWQPINSYTQILDEVDKHTKNLTFKPQIVFTGGEPLLNWDNEIFTEALKQLVKNNFNITIETNGTIQIDFEKYPVYKAVMFAISPKLSNSLEKKEKRLNIKAIDSTIRNSNKSFLKFVVNLESLTSIKNEVSFIVNNVNECDVFCMPQGGSIEQISQNDKATVAFCLENNFRYMDRLHIRIWNDKEKV